MFAQMNIIAVVIRNAINVIFVFSCRFCNISKQF